MKNNSNSRLVGAGAGERIGHTLETAHGGCILEFTYVGGLGPSLITSHGQAFT
jgi:hypothetical protein